ncbi:MAG: RsmE family RNA methyltransferase [SAR202 cluster bacterium]|nr:RsmE family RNA methyltransferase [SAR202 cluster bacterium]
MHRFFVSPQSISGSRVSLVGSAASKITRVLRGRPGDNVIVLDGSSLEYRVVLRSVSTEQVIGDVVESGICEGEPGIAITLYQAIIKGDKFEYVLQKGTELGVSSFVPIICERSIPNARKWSDGRYERWRTIVREAAEQSGRGRVPHVGTAIELREAIKSHAGPGMIPWEMERDNSIRHALGRIKEQGTTPDRIGIFIGPEGGLTLEEVDLARAESIVPITLGQRILRAETASLAVVSTVMYEWGEMGG